MTENLHATNCVRTRSGKYVNFLAPDPEDILIEDIAHGLSLVNRFVGHLVVPFNVAQHSVLCSNFVPPEHALAALLHDASEYVMGDCPKPLKDLLPEFSVVEDRLMTVISDKFGFEYPLAQEVHDADILMLQTEWDSLMLEVCEFHSLIWTPEEARMKFLSTFYTLTAQ